MKFETANGKKHVDFCFLQYSTYIKLSNGYKSKFLLSISAFVSW